MNDHLALTLTISADAPGRYWCLTSVDDKLIVAEGDGKQWLTISHIPPRLAEYIPIFLKQLQLHLLSSHSVYPTIDEEGNVNTTYYTTDSGARIVREGDNVTVIPKGMSFQVGT